MEKYCNISASMGIDHCSDRSRLGFVYHNYRLAKVYEVSVEVLSSRSINIPQCSIFTYKYYFLNNLLMRKMFNFRTVYCQVYRT